MASSIGIYFTNMLIFSVGYPLWHHCHQVFTGCSASQLRPLPFFPPGCTFSVATTIACCPCHLVRVTSTLAVGKVAEFCFVKSTHTTGRAVKNHISPKMAGRSNATQRTLYFSLSLVYRQVFLLHPQPRVKLYMLKEESFPFPTKYINIEITTCTSMDVMIEKL